MWCSPLLGCDETAAATSGGTQGSSSGGGACPVGLSPQFTLHLQAEGGELPGDMSLFVTWSAGDEPLFRLNDPATWGNAMQGSNVLCEVQTVDMDASPPPVSAKELVCALWTAGPTKIQVEAAGFETLEETLVPMQSEDCDMPLPTHAHLTIRLEKDGGTP